MRILGDIPLETWITNHVEKQKNREHPSSNHSRNHLTWLPISHHERTRRIIMFKSTPMALTPLAWKCRVSFTWQKCENLTDVFIRDSGNIAYLVCCGCETPANIRIWTTKLNAGINFSTPQDLICFMSSSCINPKQLSFKG